MNFKMMGRFLAMILLAEGLFMIPPLLIGFFEGRERTTFAFALSCGIILSVAGVLMLLTRKSVKETFRAREGLLSVGIGWLVMSFL
ncbi:MAG: TrkH family potassium uptake protein, partial [Clostridia bacterium]|nr:TrkH family potassium uptake protein [Clostridia bacterium]